MNFGKIVFAQIMQFVPRREFNDIVQKCPDEFRMVVYEDFATGNVYRFITNHLGYETLTVAELYRERWNVELFFKWIKQHLHIKSFYGTSENAVYTQI